MWGSRDRFILSRTKSEPFRPMETEPEESNMRAQTLNRRQSDRGYIAQRRTRMPNLRTLLGLPLPSASLRPLSHWRRRPAGR